jgi:hypothetical protein
MVLALALWGLGGCHGRPAQTSQADAASGAPVASQTPPAPAPQELQIFVTAEVLDAGTLPIPLSGDDPRPEIPPAHALVLQTNLPLQNYRVRVFDEADRAMASDDEAQASDGGLRYRIQFPEPLPTGHRYAVVVDAQIGPELLDSLGRSHDDVRLEFQIAGEKEKPRPPPPTRRRRRR